MSLNIKYTVESFKIPSSLKGLVKESHTGTFWMVAKALADILKKAPYQVFYPSQSVLEDLAKAGDEMDVRKALKNPNHFRFVFTATEKDGSSMLYPTILVISDDPRSDKNDPAKILASHISITDDDINQVLSTYFREDPDAVLSDIFEYIKADNGENVKGDIDVKVQDFKLNDNGTVRELCEEIMLTAMGKPGQDLDMAAEPLQITSQCMVMFNAHDPQQNALAKKSPVYDVDRDSNTVTQIGGPDTFSALRSVYAIQIREWFHPRNHTGKMWDMAWKQVAEDFMVERVNNDLDYNPYERDEKFRKTGRVLYTKETLSKIPLSLACRIVERKASSRKASKNEKIMGTADTISDIKRVMLDFLKHDPPTMESRAKVDIETEAHDYILYGSYYYEGSTKDEEVLCIRISVHGDHVSVTDEYENVVVVADTTVPADALKDYLEDFYSEE